MQHLHHETSLAVPIVIGIIYLWGINHGFGRHCCWNVDDAIDVITLAELQNLDLVMRRASTTVC